MHLFPTECFQCGSRFVMAFESFVVVCIDQLTDNMFSFGFGSTAVRIVTV